MRECKGWSPLGKSSSQTLHQRAQNRKTSLDEQGAVDTVPLPPEKSTRELSSRQPSSYHSALLHQMKRAAFSEQKRLPDVHPHLETNSEAVCSHIRQTPAKDAISQP